MSLAQLKTIFLICFVAWTESVSVAQKISEENLNVIDSLLQIREKLEIDFKSREELNLIKIISDKSANDSLRFEMLCRSFELYGAHAKVDSQLVVNQQLAVLVNNGLDDIYYQCQLSRYEGSYFVATMQNDSALVRYRASVSLARQLVYDDLLANVLSETGQIYHSKTMLDSAEHYIKQAIRISKVKNLSIYDRSVFYNNLAQVASARKDYNDQILLLKRSLFLKDSIGRNEDLEFAISANNLGLAYLNRGDHIKGLDLFEQVNVLFRQLLGEDHRFIGIIMNNIALALRNIGDTEASFNYARDALELKKRIFETDNFDLGVSYNMLASLYQREMQYDSAVFYFLKAAKSFGPENYYYPSVTGNIARTYKSNSDTANFLLYTKLSLETQKKLSGPFSSSLTQFYLLMGDYYQFVTNIRTAGIYYDSALAVVGFENGKPLSDYDDPLGLFTGLIKKAKIGDQDFSSSTTLYLHEALRLNEYLSSQSLREKDRLLVKEQSKEVIDLVIESLANRYENGKNTSTLDSLLYFMEWSKAFSIRNNLLTLNEESVSNQLVNLRFKMDSLAGTDSPDSKSELFKLQITSEKLLDRCLSCSESMPPFRTLAEIQSQIAKSELVINYYISDSHLYILSLSKDDRQFLVMDLHDTFQDWLDALSVGYNLESYQGLSPYLIPDDLKIASYDKLTIVPNGGLAVLNFELLESGGEILIHSKEVQFKRALEFSKNESPLNRMKGLVAIAPVFADQEKQNDNILVERSSASLALPGSRRETLLLKEQMDADVFLEKQASKASFLSALQEYQMLHLSTHAIVNPSNPQFSEILFSNNERVYSYELLKRPINSDLVVLSACNTGYGKFYEGEGVISISHAFMTAGAKSIVMTQWKIPDETTPEIMLEFYRNLKKGQRKSEALRNAKLNYLERQEDPLKRHPTYWAGFVLIGDDSPLEFNRGTSSMDWFLKLLLLVLLGALSYQHSKKD
ncbi:MAG: CHAT domain-containing tetratricopeptide repeat protein [Bacteroidota bacterium]